MRVLPLPIRDPPRPLFRRQLPVFSPMHAVLIGIAIGAQAEGAVRSHTRRALAEDMHPEELRHVGLLALTTIGFPHTVAGLGWIEEVIGSKS